jgi:hypothetical protein
LNQKVYSFISMRFRVREPLLAVQNESGVSPRFMTIEPGSVITIKGKEEQSGFVDVSYRGQIVQVYMRDLEKRADRVRGQTG